MPVNIREFIESLASGDNVSKPNASKPHASKQGERSSSNNSENSEDQKGNETLTLKCGDTIFHEGDNEDCLYLILDGSIEIGKIIKNNYVPLNVMSGNEILGAFAAFNDGTRTATARVISDKAVVKKITSTRIQSDMEKIPRWLKILVKDFVGRIEQMNAAYNEKKVKFEKSFEKRISVFFVCKQIISILNEMVESDLFHLKSDDYIRTSDFQLLCQKVLQCDAEMIQSIFEILIRNSIIDEKNEGSVGRVIELSKMNLSTEFSEFIDAYKKPKAKGFRALDFSSTEEETIRIVIRNIIESGKKSADKIAHDKTSLKTALKEKYNHDSDLHVMEKISAVLDVVDLLDASGKGCKYINDAEKIVIKPKDFEKSLYMLLSYRNLEELDSKVWNKALYV